MRRVVFRNTRPESGATFDNVVVVSVRLENSTMTATTTTTMMTLWFTYVRPRTYISRSRARLSVIFISRVTPRTWKAQPAVSAAPRAPPISSFKIILRPEGHSALSYPPRQITLAQHLAPTAAGRTECGTVGNTGRSNGKTRAGGSERKRRSAKEEKASVSLCARAFAGLVIYTHALIA